MAKESGIVTPNARLEAVGQSNVLLTEKFDRAGQDIRLPYLSAMSILSYKDGDHGSYLEIADSLSGHGAQPTGDKKELWKRIVLNIMISNYDDQLCNHGFLYVGSSEWRPSPVFDLEPTPAGKNLATCDLPPEQYAFEKLVFLAGTLKYDEADSPKNRLLGYCGKLR